MLSCGDCGNCDECDAYYDDYDSLHAYDQLLDHKMQYLGKPRRMDADAPHKGTSTGAAVVDVLRASGVDMKCSTSNGTLTLYDLSQQPPDKSSRWSEHASLEEERAHVQQLQDQNGIVVRIQEPDGTVQVAVQNESMKKILVSVFQGYPGFHVELLSDQGAWNFHQPFMIFAHRWEKLKSYSPDASMDPAAARLETEALSALVETMQVAIRPILDGIAKIHKTGLLEWASIPSIFPPGHLVLLSLKGVPVIARITSAATKVSEPAGQAWLFMAQFVEWDGYGFGLSDTPVRIPHYAGHKKVLDLPSYILDFAPKQEELREELTARGRKWEKLAGVFYKYFDGEQTPVMTVYGAYTAYRDKSPEPGVPVPSTGRIMIDAAAYYESNGIPKPVLTALAASSSESLGHGGLTDEQCLMASGVVHGFNLERKDWCSFPVEDISDITFNPAVFDKLVLPANEKRLAWAFVRSKNLLSGKASSTSFDDFVDDKGRGLIMLLCGPPGVGKTFTAEAIAEKARVPLYMVSAGELGTEPGKVDRALDRALGLCKKWQAMLLMDEADVFLGKRFGGEGGSIERNELVSIFLRRLEYYQGTMFLTTNQIENIDDAFQSRIDLILPYRELTYEARLQVWTNFVEKSGGEARFAISQDQLRILASQYLLNGREIKNLVKSALLVAGSVGDGDGDGGDEAMQVDEAGDGQGAKVSMEVLTTLGDMRVQVHELMGKKKHDVVQKKRLKPAVS